MSFMDAEENMAKVATYYLFFSATFWALNQKLVADSTEAEVKAITEC